MEKPEQGHARSRPSTTTLGRGTGEWASDGGQEGLLAGFRWSDAGTKSREGSRPHAVASRLLGQVELGVGGAQERRLVARVFGKAREGMASVAASVLRTNSAAVPFVSSISFKPRSGPSTLTVVARLSEVVPLGASTVTLKRPSTPTPVRGSTMCE